MRHGTHVFLRGLSAVALALSPPPASAQRVQFPSPLPRSEAAYNADVAPSWGSPTVTAPPAAAGGPSVRLGPGVQPFDPYSTSPSLGQFGPPGGIGPASPIPPAPPPSYPGQSPPFSSQPFPSQSPPILYPNGMFGSPYGGGPPTGRPYQRFLQDIYFSHTWLPGNGGSDVEINDVELGTTATFPNFLFSPHPLLLTPGFIFHFWDGPVGMPAVPNLPSKAYSAFLDAAWNPQATQQFGAELAVRVGVYSDFGTVTSDSVRVSGHGVGVLRLTPTVTVKGGVVFLDRARIKTLPAGGILWEPNPQTKFDIVFPRPKLAQFLWTIGNVDVWWYIGGEYGGGSWTIEQPMFSERIDINDIRLIGGLEWTGLRDIQGFFEVAYVFDREVIYVVAPLQSFKPDDTVMLRAGLAF